MRLFLIAALLVSTPALAVESPTGMRVSLNATTSGSWLPDDFAKCNPDGAGKTKKGRNIHPAVMWNKVPKGTKSFAIIVVDSDVPADKEHANQDGKMIPESAPREDLYHWLVIDIPARVRELPEGPVAYTQGKNDIGRNAYDGPCPPWNDERTHTYHFTVYALDVPKLSLPEDGDFTAKEMLAAMEGHILDSGKSSVLYSQYLSGK